MRRSSPKPADRGARAAAAARPAGRGGRAPEVADRLHSLAIHLLRWLRREDVASGLSGARLSALSVVVFGGPTSLGALARAEQVSAPTMSRVVSSLVAAGLVTRTSDGRDRRSVRIEATEQGQRMLWEGRRRRVSRLASALARLASEDLARVAVAVGVLQRVLDEAAAERAHAGRTRGPARRH